MSLWKRYRDAIICVALLSLPFFLLRASTRDPGQRDELDRFVVRISGPAQWLGTTIARGVAHVWDDYIYLVYVRREVERLRAETARLRTDSQRYRDAYDENRRLRRMLQLRVETPGETYAAEVVARDASPFFRVTRLAITTSERVRARVGMPVITYDGLVGQINSIVGRYANVTLTVDSRSNIDAMIERNSARGILRGTGERNRYAAQIEYLLRDNEVRVGDTVVTSGYGCRFPPGLLLGRVTAVTRRSFGLYQEVEVTPAVDFSRLHEVLVLATPQADCRPGLPAAPRRGARGGVP
jgi:rod shape-determining protein MreC